MRRALRTVLVAVALSLVVPTAVAGAETTGEQQTALGSDGRTAVRVDSSRGVVHDGLVRSGRGSDCEGGFEIVGLEGPGSCTHGPDASPFGVDVRRDAPLVSSRERARAPQAWCDPNSGTDGARVQAVYAVAADEPDRYDEVLPSIRTWAGSVEQTFANSASAHGRGERHVRWVTDRNCKVDVVKVVVSETGDDSFANTITEVKAAGYDQADRKFLIWMDANKLCGIANMYNDDRDDVANYNNGAFPMYARVDSGCWGLDPSVEAHELMHNLGAVQPSAPNSNGSGHCTDDADRMCYAEGDHTTTQRCENSWESLFDCGGDDYFNPTPEAGTYLADHWNTADSRFLTSEPSHVVQEPPGDARQWRRVGRLTRQHVQDRRRLSVGDGPFSIDLSGRTNGGRAWKVIVRDDTGNRVVVASGSRRTSATAELAAGTYTVTVRGGRGRYTLVAKYLA